MDTAIGKKKMIQSSSNPALYAEKTKDNIHVICFSHGRFENDYFLAGEFCRIGISDGTLIIFDDTKSKPFNVVHKGDAFIREKDNMIYFDDKQIDWIVYGDER